jgi:predicted nuclease of restriction endonuclease-like (RecB) superfamily
MRRKPPPKVGTVPEKSMSVSPVEDIFVEIVTLIEQARQLAYQTVNTQIIDLYWKVGETISAKLETAAWGEGVVDQLALYLARAQPGLKGFSRQNLFRMKLFYETYRDDEKLSPLVRELPWTHNLIIMGQCKRPEEREFYLRLSIRERWGKRELERQLRCALFERTILNPPKVSPPVRQIHPTAVNIFKDSYVVEFLNLPAGHSEPDLHQSCTGKAIKGFYPRVGTRFLFCRFRIPAPGRRA